MAQDSLIIQSFSIPDTVEFNETIQVSLTVVNESQDSRTGNLRFFLRNESNNNIEFQLTNFSALQFFAPFQPRSFQFPIEIHDDVFRLGGNTVVIWPSFVGNPDNQNTIVKEIYVRDINQIQSLIKLKENLNIFPNPFTSSIHLNSQLPPKSNFLLKNLQGQTLFEQEISYEQTILIPDYIQHGIFITEIHVGSERILNRLMVRLPK